MSIYKNSIKIKCVCAGALAGAANGLFGAGGGMILVPAFTRLVGLDTRKAYASSIAAVLPISAASACVYLFQLRPPLISALPYLVGGLVGGFIGGMLFKKVPPAFLKKAFGLLLIYGGIRCFL